MYRNQLRVFTTIGLLLGVAFFVVPFQAFATKPPNVVMILMDDLGWADLGLTGSTFYETPNVDALAKEGVFFTDAYAASPVCSPTRASILTGKYPSRIKMSYLASSRGPYGPKHKLVPPEVADNMPLEDTTLAEALREAGYTTAHIGKWHLQSHHKADDAHRPEKNGFDVNIAGHRAGQPGSYYYPYKNEKHAWSNVPDMEDGKEGDYLTDALTDKAIDFIKSNRKKPFYLSMWYHTVHTPIQPRKDKLEKYRAKAEAMGLNKTNKEAIPDHQSLSHAHQDNPAYAAMVESMDENIGRILDTLKKLRLEKKTIVIFFSDNGGLSTGSGPNFPTSNFPLRAGKGWVYEGGIREPLIIKYPRVVKAGVTIEEPVISTDLYPTILDLANLPLRPEQHLDGVSLEPLLTGTSESLDREAIFFHLPHYHHINTMGPSGAIRMGDFKLIEVFETGELELYNLREDMGEQTNLFQTMPDRVIEMTLKLRAWREKSGAEMPALNRAYQPDDDWRKPKKPVAPKATEPTAGATKFFTPKQDLDGLKANTAIKAGLPNVLIIGDSISIGYTQPVMELMKDKANVQRVKTNCGDTNKGLEKLGKWLGDTKWDVIHFNWGLHDLCYRNPDSKAQGKRDKLNGTQSVSVEQYEKNLETLVLQLKATGATLIWATTTVVPEGELGRVLGDDDKYNAVAEKIMQKHGVAINDLHALSKEFDGKYSAQGNVHFNKDGSAKLAEQVADNMLAAMAD